MLNKYDIINEISEVSDELVRLELMSKFGIEVDDNYFSFLMGNLVAFATVLGRYEEFNAEEHWLDFVNKLLEEGIADLSEEQSETDGKQKFLQLIGEDGALLEKIAFEELDCPKAKGYENNCQDSCVACWCSALENGKVASK